MLVKEFEKRYELYGRRVEWVDFESRFGNDTQETQGRGREGACLDAEVVANELKAFAVIGDRAAVSKPFADCAAQRGVVVLNGASYGSEKFYRDRHPYAWAFITSCDRINYQVGEYIGKRLVEPAGQVRRRRRTPPSRPGSSASTRRSATARTTPAGRSARRWPRSTASARTRRYKYVLDVSRFPDEAARGAIQLKRDGVTSVIMACDPISMIFLHQSATSQGWHPEWILIGIILTDTDNAARLYDQTRSTATCSG